MYKILKYRFFYIHSIKSYITHTWRNIQSKATTLKTQIKHGADQGGCKNTKTVMDMS